MDRATFDNSTITKNRATNPIQPRNGATNPIKKVTERNRATIDTDNPTKTVAERNGVTADSPKTD